MKKILSLTILFALTAQVDAAQWQILGTRPLGMGGAFVAVTEGPISQYWNPGGLVKHDADNYSGMQIPVGVNIEATGNIAKNASEIADMADQFKTLKDAQDNGTTVSAKDISYFVKTLALLDDLAKDDNKGLLVDANAGVNFKFSKVALSINNFTTVGFTPTIDTVHVGLDSSGGGTGINMGSAPATVNGGGDYDGVRDSIKNAIDIIGFSSIEQVLCGPGGCSGYDATTLANYLVNEAISNGMSVAQVQEAANMMNEYADSAKPVVDAIASGNSYKDNTSSLTADAVSMVEIAAGYAWNIPAVPGLSVGGNLKMINGYTTVYEYKFMEDGSMSDYDWDKDVESSWAPAADIGILWKANKTFASLPFNPKAGLVVRNINSPKFKRLNGLEDYKLDRQARFGVALNPFNFWTLAADIDLTENDTNIKGFKSRQLAVGTEINLVNSLNLNIPLRVGILQNIAESSSKYAYTAGIGLHLVHLQVDLSGMISSDSTEIDKKTYPTHAGASLGLSLLF